MTEQTPPKRVITPAEIMKQLEALPKKELAKVLAATGKSIPQCFIPSPGPQTKAYYSPADVLLYGGEAGGGKSALVNGLALTAHKRSLIMRRQYTDLTALVESALDIYGSRDGYNGSAPPSLKTKDGRFIQWGAAALPGSEQSWKGQAHDLKAFDEVTDFLESQVRFIIGWNRTTEENQRCRVVFASNPPTDPAGDWLIGMFRPWLDFTYHNPAKDGELRWYITDAHGNEHEVDGPEPRPDGFKGDGTPRLVIPKSRTFIRSSLSDNPYLANTGYEATLDAMPEPYRSAYRDGNFMMARVDHEAQCIPTEWVRAAQARWKQNGKPNNVPMCAMGVDPAAGGPDETVLAPRYDGFYDELIIIPGAETPYPQDVGAKVVRYRKSQAIAVVDCGGGYGGGVVRHLEDNGIEAKSHKGVKASAKRTADKQHGFSNTRTEVYWRFREALDPSQDGGSIIALPADQKLLADLCSPRFTIGKQGGQSVIILETKEDVKARLGRSPDRGDAVVIAWVHGGTIANQKGGVWQGTSKQRPNVVMGHLAQRRSR